MWEDFKKYCITSLILVILVGCVPIFLVSCYAGAQLGVSNTELFGGYVVLGYISFVVLISIICHMRNRIRDVKEHNAYESKRAEEKANRIIEEMLTSRETELRNLRDKYLGTNAEV